MQLMKTPISATPLAPPKLVSPVAAIVPDDAGGKLPMTQRLTLTLDGRVIAHARWHATASDDGVFQIADLFVDPLHQRKGHGSRLLREMYEHAIATFRSLGITPRRVWVCVEQKRHVTARAFFSKHGFQHVATMKEHFVDQDAMLYSRSFN